MVYKTREKLIEVARQLFVHKGWENTTMNDIANASEKGRRTIYTYFRNKKEIYDAITETDSDKMVKDLRAIVNSDFPPAEKLRNFLKLRLDQGVIIRSSSFSLNSILKFDRKRTERIRQLVYDKEISMFKSIIDEGVSEGVFNPERTRQLSHFIGMIIHALDLADIEPERQDESRSINNSLVDFIVSDITTAPQSKNSIK